MATKRTLLLISGHPGYELLEDHGKILGPSLVWISYAELLAGGLDKMKLNAGGDAPDPIRGAPMIAGIPHPKYYRFLVNYFTDQGYDLQYAYLDWRKKMETIGPVLAQKIFSLGSKSPIDIICHSAGGLYLRFAMKWLKKLFDVSKLIHRIVGLNCPHWGSYQPCQAVKGVLGYVKEEGDLVAWTRVTGSVPSALADRIPGIIQSFPNLYQLLPNPAAPGLKKEEADFIYSKDSWGPDMVVTLQTKLDYAKSEWTTITKDWDGPEWLAVRCNKSLTPIALDLNKTIDKLTTAKFAFTGDGIVPYDWQKIPGMAEATFDNIDHDKVCQNKDVADTANTWFQQD